MNLFQYNSDNLNRKGYISKESILSLVTQEDIYELVFKFKPVEYDYVVSPLRKDSEPGCWFYYHQNGILYFVDFGHSRTHSDCFNMVQDYYKLGNFYLTLEFIYNSLIRGKEQTIEPIEVKKVATKKSKEGVKLLIEARKFSAQDANYWSQYQIKKENLMQDKVFPVHRLYALNTKSGSHIIECNDLAYSYTDFSDSRKKIYFPLRQGKNRFITNCNKDDVGGINFISQYCKKLIITKSYKDYRVLKNNGKNVVWFQNEGMIPNDVTINKLVKLNTEIIVWYDNDQPGILASEKVKQHLNSIVPGIAKNLWLPERALEFGVKDPSDCIAKDPHYFQQFLKTFVK
jgi:hypothetical protein